MTDTLLRVRHLRTYFWTLDGIVKAVDGVNMDIGTGRTLGVVGESGCGKSITALSIMRLIERPGKIVEGSVDLDRTDLLKLSESEMREIRGNAISMIFQEPMTSLNPVFTTGNQIAEAIRLHADIGAREAEDRAVEMLRKVGIPDPERRARQYPHEMSGGMRQRVMIAMALSTYPQLLIADEPTTALDVTIQAQILELMKELREERRMSIMLITHDLGVIAEMADDVVVMYSGKVVETGDVFTIFERPHHPYTQGLLGSLPRIGQRRGRLRVIEGVVPNPLNLPKGCLFARRCPCVMPICEQTPPPFQEVHPGQVSRCWLTPAGTTPAVGMTAPADVAEAEAARMTITADSGRQSATAAQMGEVGR
ncbi:MAG: ABC transporter ATP-binding protein [Chloroflexi bacterium]|nr:ABC transporter ATP-binding protein [Chloroflexota bacterium]